MKHLFRALLILLSYQTQAGSYQLFEENGKTGLKDDAGNILIPARFEALGWSNGSFSVVQFTTGYKQNNGWGLISLHNEIITSPDYADLLPTESGIILAAKRNPVTLNVLWGGLNPAGKTVIPIVYAGIHIEGLRAVTYSVNSRNELRYGLTNLQHRTLLPAVYKNIKALGNLRFAVQDTLGKTALFTEDGTSLTGFTFDSIGAFSYGKAIVYLNGRQGIITSQGQTTAKPVYREIKQVNNTWMGRQPDTWLILQSDGKVEKQYVADTLLVTHTRMLALLNGNVLSMMDYDQQHVNTTLKADVILPVSESDKLLIGYNGNYGVIHPDGTFVLPMRFARIIHTPKGWIAEAGTSAPNRWQLFDATGKALSERYDFMEPFNTNFFRVRKNGFEGLINSNGTNRLPCIYDRIAEERHGLVVVVFRGGHGIVNTNDQWVVAPRPHPIKVVSKHTYLEQQGNLQWLRNLEGTALYFTNNPLRLEGEYLKEETATGARWLIDAEGRIINRESPPALHTSWTGPSSEGFRPVRRNGRYGFINDAGLLLIPNRYEDVMPFSEGRAGIKIRNKWGFIDLSDRITVQPVYDKAQPFVNGTAKVCQKNKWGLIDKDGNILVPLRYDSLNLLPSGRVLVQADGYFGLADTQGNLLLHTKYDWLTELNNGMVIVKQNGKYGVTDVNGLAIISVNYDYLAYHPALDRFICRKTGQWQMLP